MACRVLAYSTVVSMAIAHTQIEAIKSPSITALTMTWADQNNPKIDRSEELSPDKPCCAISAAFMAQVLSADRRIAKGGAVRGTMTAGRAASRAMHRPTFREFAKSYAVRPRVQPRIPRQLCP